MGIANENKRRWVLTWAFALLPFVGFWCYGLFDLDEGFYGAATAEMNRRGEWIIPYYNGNPWFEKPILLYWFAKPALAFFGDIVGPRLPTVLASIATLAIVAWFCRRRFSDAAAQLAVLALSGSLLFAAVGRMMLTDPLLVLCLTAAFLTFYESLVGNPKWRLVAALALGFSVLAKGPVGLVLFAVLAGWTFWREPALRPRFRGYWLLGTAILVAVISLWYLPVYLQRPVTFFDEFVIRQNFGRFVGGDEAHKVGWPEGLIYYVPILLVGLLPWALWIPKAAKERAGDPALRFLLAWAFIVFAFFTASGSKLPHYILPAVPPLVMLIAHHLASRTWAMRLAHAWVVLVALVVNVGFYGWYHGWFPGTADQSEVHAIARYLRDKPGIVALYQMSRRDKALGTGELKIQETSLPSILMYLDRTVYETDYDEDFLEMRDRPWIITRADRITPVEIWHMHGHGGDLVEVRVGGNTYYRLYRLN